VLKVSGNSDATAAAGAIANGIRSAGTVDIQVIGPRAVNQAIKAIAIARGFLAAGGLDVYCVPSFASIQVGAGQQERTAIHFAVRTRHDLKGG
jgi:stage V sporulation protein S